MNVGVPPFVGASIRDHLAKSLDEALVVREGSQRMGGGESMDQVGDRLRQCEALLLVNQESS